MGGVEMITIPAALIMGLSFGAGPCNITCLPYLGPVFLADNPKRWRMVALFSSGRLTGYALLGLLAGALGSALEAFLQSAWVGVLLGTATILVGLHLLRRGGKAVCQTAGQDKSRTQVVSFAETTSGPRTSAADMKGGLFFMGMGMAFNPCAPLGAILLAASATASAVSGLGLGLGFGVGAVLIPALIFGGLVAHFGQQIREHLGHWQGRLNGITGVMLMLLGGMTAVGWVGP